ncbi:MAG: class I SAM-dependent methyltransferase [bacterium]
MEREDTRAEVIARLRPYVDRAHRLKGFRLEVEPVPLGPPLPWNYEVRARELLTGARSVLDMGTGGGEVFSEILAGYDVFAVATEPWLPNVSVAAGWLRPFGALVVHANSLALPFADEAFDLILNRHEELDPAEVARVLARGGHLLTQQVIPENWKELRAFFPRMTHFGPHFEQYQDGLRAGGLVIRSAERHETLAAYHDLGDIAYLLTALPWEVPDFDVSQDIEALMALERALRRPEGIVLTEGRYLIEGYKPAAEAKRTPKHTWGEQEGKEGPGDVAKRGF